MKPGRAQFFRRVTDSKEFERLCTDLLEAEGFRIESEPSVDRTGIDFIASEEYRSHASGDAILVRWKVQCKRYSTKNLGRSEMERILWAFDAGRREGDALLIMLTSDYSEEAQRVATNYTSSRPGIKIAIWNQRQVYARLAKHPEILRRYGGGTVAASFVDVFSDLKSSKQRRVLILSDQSALSHNFVVGFREAQWEVVFLPVWNYSDPARVRLLLSSRKDFTLAILFLGDSFGFPLSLKMQNILLEMYRSGTPFMLFPFLAWSLHRWLLPAMFELCPVRLLDGLEAESTFGLTLAEGGERLGDFGNLLSLDSFAENRYSEYDPGECTPDFAVDINEPFGLMHTFEFLIEDPYSTVRWRDRNGIPFLVTGERENSRACYLNTCCHSCMSSTPVISPLEASIGFAYLVRNCILWLLGRGSIENDLIG